MKPKPFGEELLARLRTSYFVTASGRPNLAAFARRLNGVSYEKLRRAVRGSGRTTAALIEECARVLGVMPDVFSEYRLRQLAEAIDPDRAGLNNAAKALHDYEYGAPEDEDLPPFSPEAVAEVYELLTTGAESPEISSTTVGTQARRRR